MWGAWVAQLAKCLTFDFGSGHDLAVCEVEPHVGLCTDSMQSAWDSLSLPLPCTCALSLSLKINLKKFLFKYEFGHFTDKGIFSVSFHSGSLAPLGSMGRWIIHY